MPYRFTKVAVSITGLALLVLAACGGKGQNIAAVCEGTKSPIGNFSLCLPEGIAQVTKPFGEQSNTLVLIQNEEDQTLLMRIHVKKDPLQNSITSNLEFAQQAADFSRRNAPKYAAVSTDPLIVDRKEILLHIFDAQPEAENAPVRYYQFVTTHESIAYGFTAIMADNVDETIVPVLIEIFTSVEFT